jgi:phage-related protein
MNCTYWFGKALLLRSLNGSIYFDFLRDELGDYRSYPILRQQSIASEQRPFVHCCYVISHVAQKGRGNACDEGGFAWVLVAIYQNCDNLLHEKFMPGTRVAFYRDADGQAPVVNWLRDLMKTNPKAWAHCRARIEMLAQFGHELRRPAADYLPDGIYELRAKQGHVQYRILYFFHQRELPYWHTV